MQSTQLATDDLVALDRRRGCSTRAVALLGVVKVQIQNEDRPFDHQKVGRAVAPAVTIDFFLTAYDPSDLPGSSIDPLGFERGYLFLADKILPGLTNVAARPRYFAVLCAGIHLAGVEPSATPRAAYTRRLEVLLRLERLWGLANVLAAQSGADDTANTNGIRGLRYVQAQAARLVERRSNSTNADFKVLSRQAQYGVVGIYAAGAEGMRMLNDRRQLSLTPDLGDRLAEAFISESVMPLAVQAAATDNKPVPLAVLTDWGKRAHVSTRGGSEERRCLKNALVQNDVRRRMATVLANHPATTGDGELRRLARVEQTLRGDAPNLDLHEATSLILAYEAAYRVAQLGLERLLWLCRSRQSLEVNSLAVDEVLNTVRERLPSAARKLNALIDAATTQNMCANLPTLEDVRRFLADAAAAADDGVQPLSEAILKRHADVQHGKFDRGRRKAPWLERVDARIALTSTQVGGLQREAGVPADITPHFYRTESADALRWSAGLS